jgi:apolipoprotein N-acyltransferase
MILSQPPISSTFVAYIALIPLILTWQGSSMRRNFLSGFVAGFVSYLGLIYWVVVAMNRYGGIDIYTSSAILILLVLYLSLYTGLFALVVPYMERKLSIPFFISAPVVWVLLEYARGIILTGFPWSLLAYSQHKFLPLIQVVSVTGPYFISFLIVAANCVLYPIFIGKIKITWDLKMRRTPGTEKPGKYYLIYTAVIVVLFATALLYGYRRMDTKSEGNLKVAIIQGNIPQDVKWDETFKMKIVRTYYRKTLEAGEGTDLVIWPETAMPFIFNDELYVNKTIKELAAALKTDLLFGTVTKDIKGRYYNTAYIYNEAGELAGSYNKVHLVPFGEFTPLLRYFPFMAGLTAPCGNFTSGEAHKPIETKTGKIGILICYEGIFPYITNDTVRNGAQVLVNITNDAWFGKTSAPYQHLAFYVFRAIETDRYVLRAANTGISAIIDPGGRTIQKTGIFTEDVIRGSFSLQDGQTLYVRYGDYFVLAAFLFLASLCGIKSIKFKIKGGKG